MLMIFAEPNSLDYEGGPTNVGKCLLLDIGRSVLRILLTLLGMVMDWRQLAGKPTVHALQSGGPWRSIGVVWSGGKQVGSEDMQMDFWDGRIDPRRGWVIAVCWVLASAAE